MAVLVRALALTTRERFQELLPLVSTALPFLLLLFLSYLVATTILSYRRLRHIPGPFLASVSKLWVLRAITSGRSHLTFHETSIRYGPVSRIGPNQVLISDPHAMRRTLSVRAGYRRSDWYLGVRLEPGCDNVVSTRHEGRHAEIRAKLVNGYSGKDIADLEGVIDRNMLAFAHLIDSRSAVPQQPSGGSTSTASASGNSRDRCGGQPFDFAQKAKYFALDVTTELSFGEPFGDMATDSDVHGYIKTTERTVPVMVLTTELPWLVNVLELGIIKRFLPSDKDLLGIGKAMGIAKEVVAERYGPNAKVVPDILDSFVRHGLSQKEAEAEALVLIVAGTSTVITAIVSTLLHLLSTPRAYAALLAEIAAVKPPSPVPDDFARTRMPYLQAVIREGIRMHPPGAALMTKTTPQGGDWIETTEYGDDDEEASCEAGKDCVGGDNDKQRRRRRYFIPGGTAVGSCAWGLARHRATWGDDADVFRPERWMLPLESDEQRRQKLRDMEATFDLFFSVGRWQCLGKRIALIELNKVFVELLRRFDFAIVNPMRPLKTVNFGLSLHSEFWLTATRREPLL